MIYNTRMIWSDKLGIVDSGLNTTPMLEHNGPDRFVFLQQYI